MNITTILNYNEWFDIQYFSSNLTETEIGPEYLQFTVWTLQSNRQWIHSWILQVVVTQVHLSQTRGLGAENWGQSFTASPWQITATQPEKQCRVHMWKPFCLM